MSEPMAEQSPLEPVGFYCNHEDEPLGSRTHQAQSWTDDGLQVEANPHVYKAIGWEQTCPRAVPVYAVDVPALLAEVERLRAAVDLLGKQLQGGALDVKEALQFGTERLAIEDVESFLKRERDEYSHFTRQWSAIDEVLDAFRLHMVTGTPLTEPTPVEGSADPFAGSPTT